LEPRKGETTGCNGGVKKEEYKREEKSSGTALLQLRQEKRRIE